MDALELLRFLVRGSVVFALALAATLVVFSLIATLADRRARRAYERAVLRHVGVSERRRWVLRRR
jgi:hypothetical protein